MQHITRSARTFCLILIVALLTLAQTDSLAAKPWGADDKPGQRNGNSGSGKPNKAPTIDGTPSGTAVVDQYYSFQANASDRDGDPLKFSISNKPAWAAFDTARGFLSGYPDAADAGRTSSNIVISVSDGKATASLAPFSITVAQASNSPPVISGTPPREVMATQPYSFTPNATDADNDSLRFSISNKPAWASFNTTSGRLYGTPSDAEVGVYENIRISVSDGTASSSLAAFSIAVVQTTNGTVTLNWTAPDQNVDGSALTNLAGYRVYYGSTSGQYTNKVEISGAGVVTAVIGNLSQGAWYFAATAVNSSGLESSPSNEVQKVVK